MSWVSILILLYVFFSFLACIGLGFPGVYLFWPGFYSWRPPATLALDKWIYCWPNQYCISLSPGQGHWLPLSLSQHHPVWESFQYSHPPFPPYFCSLELAQLDSLIAVKPTTSTHVAPCTSLSPGTQWVPVLGIITSPLNTRSWHKQCRHFIRVKKKNTSADCGPPSMRSTRRPPF